MTSNMYNIGEITEAYKKLKSYIFYSTNTIKYKIAICEFEWGDKVDSKLQSLLNSINSNDDNLEKLIESISYYTLPKAFSENTGKDEPYIFISNKNLSNHYIVSKVTNFINCPAEILIISMLWVLKIGILLETKVNENCIANRLLLDEESTLPDYQLITFEKYYEAYTRWRDYALKKARSLHEGNQNALIINLDIKDYFNQVDLDLSKFSDIPSEHKGLNEILNRIHAKYKTVLKKKKNILPIGLPSSNILSNVYLKKLDNSIENLSPAYYGRYVDDILIVLPQQIKEKGLTERIVEILSKADFESTEDGKSFKFKIDDNELEVQSEKLKILYFEKGEPITLLEEFERKIRENSSEFRMLPEEDNVTSNIDRDFYDVVYSDNINKIRSLEGFKTNKFGVSKALSKLLSLVNDLHSVIKHEPDDILERIRSFFSGARALDLIIYAEKTLTYYSLIGSIQEFYFMFKNILDSIFITSVEVNGIIDEKETEALRKTLVEHLIYSMSFAAVYNPKLIEPSEFDKKIKVIKNRKWRNILSFANYNFIHELSKKIIKANMMRHNLINIPMANYLADKDYLKIMQSQKPKQFRGFDEQKVKYSPRYIHRGEIQLFYDLKQFCFLEENYRDNAKLFSDEITKIYKQINSISTESNEDDPIVKVFE